MVFALAVIDFPCLYVVPHYAVPRNSACPVAVIVLIDVIHRAVLGIRISLALGAGPSTGGNILVFGPVTDI